MISYVIKFVICSGILIAVYHLFLEREKMFRFNRFYLLSAILFSIGIPLITVEMANEPLLHTSGIVHAAWVEDHVPTMTFAKEPVPATDNGFPDYLPWLGYSLISLILLSRFTINIIAVLRQRSKCKVIGQGNVKLVLVPGDITSYTFLNNIFISAETFESGHFKDEILTHEKAHATQQHSLDIILIELIGALLWFNPFLYFYKKAIRLNHEYLADESVLGTFNNVKSYQLLLLDTILHKQDLALASSFNYSITKKRLAMMTKIKNLNRQYVKQFTIALLAFALTLTFSEKIYSQIEAGGKKVAEAVPEIKVIQFDKPSARKKGDDGNPRIKFGPGISKSEIEEFYNTIEQNTTYVVNKKGRTDPMVRMAPEMEDRMYALFSQMTREQQSAAADSGVMIFQMDIPVKKAPTPEIFENWKRADIFGVWIDGKHVPNTELNKYKHTDIAEYDLSKLYGGALKGRSYKYQLDLNTNAYFDKNYQRRIKDRVIITRAGWIGEKPKRFRNKV